MPQPQCKLQATLLTNRARGLAASPHSALSLCVCMNACNLYKSICTHTHTRGCARCPSPWNFASLMCMFQNAAYTHTHRRCATVRIRSLLGHTRAEAQHCASALTMRRNQRLCALPLPDDNPARVSLKYVAYCISPRELSFALHILQAKWRGHRVMANGSGMGFKEKHILNILPSDFVQPMTSLLEYA